MVTEELLRTPLHCYAGFVIEIMQRRESRRPAGDRDFVVPAQTGCQDPVRAPSNLFFPILNAVSRHLIRQRQNPSVTL